MENEIYFRDYKDEYQKKQKSLESRFSESVLTHAEENGFFKAYEAAWREIPKAILPQSKANYEKVLSLCDSIAKRWGGSIHGEVRYDKWDAIIDLVLPFIEFAGTDEMEMLAFIAKAADSVTFESLGERSVKAHIFFKYFTDVIDEDEKEAIIDNLIEQDSKLKDMLTQSIEMRFLGLFDDEEKTENGDT